MVSAPRPRAPAPPRPCSCAVQQAQAQLQGRGGAGGRGRGALTIPDFTSAQRVDAPAIPQLAGDETFFEALFAGAPGGFAELRAKAAKGEPLAAASMPVTISIDIDNTFETVSEQRTRNVVGTIEGTDATLKRTYVMFGAHLDHIGYSQVGAGVLPTTSSCRSRSEVAQAAVKAAGKSCRIPAAGAVLLPPRLRLAVRGPPEPPRHRRFPSSNATSSATVPTMMGRDRRRCWRSRRHLRPDRSRSVRSSSSGTPERRAGCKARVTTPTSPSFRSTTCRPCSTWIWWAATIATTWKATTRTQCSSSVRIGSAPTSTI